jgi:hypothetical protein
MRPIQAPDRAFIVHKARQVTRSLVQNLKHRAHRHAYALGPRPAGRSGTAVVVGAGPSLARSGEILQTLQREGATILTVNTALPAVSQFVRPDVVVAREVVDVSQHLHYPAGRFVLDLAAAPSVWDAAGDRAGVSWFVAGALQNFEIAYHLGVRPLFGGSSAMSACVALASEWGASSIILVGADLAFAPDGTGYAQGSAFAGYRADVSGDRARIEGEGFEAMHRQAAAGGVVGPPAQQRIRHVTAYGGHGTVAQLLTWADQQDWLETFAARHPEIECVDATGAGARKHGWCEVTAPKGTGTAMPIPHGISLPRERFDRVLADIRRQTETAGSMGVTVADPEGCVVAVPGYLNGCDVVESAAAGRLLEIQALPVTLPEKVKLACEAFGTAAAEIADLV